MQWVIQILLAVLFLCEFGPKWKMTIKLLSIQLIGIRNFCPLFDQSVHASLETEVDELLHIQQISGIFIYFLLLFGFLNLPWKVSVPLYTVNFAVGILVIVMAHAILHKDLEDTLNHVIEKPFKPVFMLVTGCISLILFQKLISISITSKLQTIYDRYMFQEEQNLIMSNLSSGIVTTSDSQIKYFNENGKKIIQDVIDRFTELDTKLKITNEINQLAQTITSQKQPGPIDPDTLPIHQ